MSMSARLLKDSTIAYAIYLLKALPFLAANSPYFLKTTAYRPVYN